MMDKNGTQIATGRFPFPKATGRLRNTERHLSVDNSSITLSRNYMAISKPATLLREAENRPTENGERFSVLSETKSMPSLRHINNKSAKTKHGPSRPTLTQRPSTSSSFSYLLTPKPPLTQKNNSINQPIRARSSRSSTPIRKFTQNEHSVKVKSKAVTPTNPTDKKVVKKVRIRKKYKVSKIDAIHNRNDVINQVPTEPLSNYTMMSNTTSHSSSSTPMLFNKNNVEEQNSLDYVPSISTKAEQHEIGLENPNCDFNDASNISGSDDELCNASEENEDGFDTDIECISMDNHEKKKCLSRPGSSQSYFETCQDIGVIPIGYLAKCFDQNYAEMKYHGVGNMGSAAVCKALKVNTSLEQLDLTGNHLGRDGGLMLSLALHDNIYLTCVDLTDNLIGAIGGISFAKTLMQNSTIKTLILKGNRFTDKVAQAFAEMLKTNTTLHCLDLSYNEFGELGGLYLGAGLGINAGLKTLNLKWNGICNKGAVSLAAALKINDTLMSLDMSWNGICYIGCLAFGRYLRKNQTLEHLDLSNNRISPKGAVKLSLAFGRHPALISFKLGLNPIGDEGVEALLSAVRRNQEIKYVGLEDITVSRKIDEEITAMMFERDITIKTGGVGGFSRGQPPPSGIEILVQFIQDNRLRLKDLFFQFDKDQSGDISREEFQNGLKECGLKMSQSQLDALIEQIDQDKNNLIEYSEILAGRDHVRKERRFQRKVAIRTEQREKESITLPHLVGFTESPR